MIGRTNPKQNLIAICNQLIEIAEQLDETAPQGCKCYGPGKILHVPDLPLNVRVAKALGMNPYPEYVGKPPLPAYDTDLTLAMGALEEYCGENELTYVIEARVREWGYAVTFRERKSVRNLEVVSKAIDTSLPTAICEAIVKHKEGK